MSSLCLLGISGQMSLKNFRALFFRSNFLAHLADRAAWFRVTISLSSLWTAGVWRQKSDSADSNTVWTSSLGVCHMVARQQEDR